MCIILKNMSTRFLRSRQFQFNRKNKPIYLPQQQKETQIVNQQQGVVHKNAISSLLAPNRPSSDCAALHMLPLL